MKGEYSYMGFGTTVMTSDAVVLQEFRSRNELHIAKIGTNYRF